jgi:hypothetical protein
VLLFFLASDRLGQQGLSSISGSWGNGTILRPAAGWSGQEATTLTSDVGDALAQDHQEVCPLVLSFL